MTESKKLKEVKLVYYNQQKTLSNGHRKIDRIIKIEHVMCRLQWQRAKKVHILSAITQG